MIHSPPYTMYGEGNSPLYPSPYASRGTTTNQSESIAPQGAAVELVSFQIVKVPAAGNFEVSIKDGGGGDVGLNFLLTTAARQFSGAYYDLSGIIVNGLSTQAQAVDMEFILTYRVLTK